MSEAECTLSIRELKSSVGFFIHNREQLLLLAPVVLSNKDSIRGGEGRLQMARGYDKQA